MSIKNGANKFPAETDYSRWGKESSLSPTWDTRTEMLAGLIKPGASVLEFGAGRMVLKNILPANCVYTPSDLVDRKNGTWVCDLNSPELPAFPSHDVAVFSGVLEYLNDLPRLAAHLSVFVQEVVASYAVTDFNSGKRRKRGWVNDFSATEFVQIFRQNGFLLDREDRWQKQMIYRFVKRNVSADTPSPS